MAPAFPPQLFPPFASGGKTLLLTVANLRQTCWTAICTCQRWPCHFLSFVLFFLRPSSLGSSYLSPVLRPEAVCFFNLVCRRHVSSGLVGLVEPTGDMCPSVIRTLLLRRLTIRANDWAGRDSATFTAVCKFDVWEEQRQFIQYHKSLIINSKGRASRITLDTWQSEASCYLRIPQGGNSSQRLTKSQV